MRRAWLVGGIILTLIMAFPASAHEVRPGYLELRQTGADTFDVLWKVPAKGNLRLGIYARLPENCEAVSEVVSTMRDGAYTDRWRVNCPGGLTGGTISIDGLSGTLTDTLARIEQSNGASQVVRLTPASPAFVVKASPSWYTVAGTYLGLGADHILRGIDHLLFVLALLLLVETRRRLLAAVTAFTVAHSLTLAAATLGLVHVPQQPVEAIIALSIVFVAAEIVRSRSGQTSLTQEFPWAIAFTFGLLHGFGFAGALSEIGLPEQAIPVALLFFNLGVESGQLLFIAGALLLAALARPVATRSPTWAPQLPAYGIGAMAAFWTIERLVGF